MKEPIQTKIFWLPLTKGEYAKLQKDRQDLRMMQAEEVRQLREENDQLREENDQLRAKSEAPRPAATKLHLKLKNRMYRFAEKHSLTGFEVAGVMFAIATEVMASALVRDGLLQGGPDFAEEAEDAPGDSERVQELLRENKTLCNGLYRMTDRCTQLSGANTEHLAHIAQLEDALRVMAELALSEIKKHRAKLLDGLVTGKELQEFTDQETRINDLLHRLGVTLTTQEPQS
jgi:predicted nuclease with TOPRIM domain